jgi:universal stress protein A
MIKEIPINESHILALRVSGKLVEDDYTQFLPRLEKILQKEKKISLLLMLEDFEGWSAKAALKDIQTGWTHDDDFLRIAIVGENNWQKLIASFGNLFMDTKIRYFNEESDAIEWLKQIQNLAEQDEYIGYRHILVASDFSEYAEMALKKATEIATPFNAKITVIHAAEVLSAEIYPALGELSIPVLADNPDFEKKQMERLQKELDDSIHKLNFSNISTAIETGHPVDTILEYALKHNVDLIVMGSHGRRGLARLLGSSTNGVINHAPCDVLTVV